MNVMNPLVTAAIVLGVASPVLAESTGPLSPDSITVSDPGDYAWTDNTPISQASIDDNNATIVMLGGGLSSDELFASNFGASVPLDATVVGIKVTFELATTGLGVPDLDVATLTMGSMSTKGTPLVVDLPDTGNVFISASIGDASDTWGLTLTPVIVNDAGFGLFSQNTTNSVGTQTLDLTQMEIFYTLPGDGPRILIIGDSWAAGIGNQLVFEDVLSREGGLATVSLVKEGIGATTASQWASNDAGKLDTITTALNNNPTIDIVHINLGGNDLALVASSIETEQDLLDALEVIADDIDIVVAHIHSINPNIRVGLGSYDYLNAQASNAALIAMVSTYVSHAATTPGLDVINAMGYVHHIFGFPGEFAPGETPLPGGFPEYDPLWGGDPAFAGTPAYNDGGVHLLFAGYVAYIERCFNEFYRSWLLEDAGGAEIWIDFAHRGDERGTFDTPMNDLTNAATMVNPGGTIKIKGGTADNSTPETLTLDKAMRIEAVDGPVTIGAPSARRSAPDVEVKSGFVSRQSR